jgi:hypothetical protein
MKVYRVDYDGFEGVVIGTYSTLEGKLGVVLQQIGTRVVHVYGRTRLTEVGEYNDVVKKETG